MNLPIEFEEKMQDLLGGEYNDYLKCYEEPRHYGLRVNTSKISIDRFLEIAPWPLRPIPWIENGFYYDGEKYQPAKHPYYFAGLYYLQEPSAMTPANRLPIEAGDRVLDVCAAPGGKATELGAKLNGSGVLIANDLSNSRARGLLKNIELFGIGNVLVRCAVLRRRHVSQGQKNGKGMGRTWSGIFCKNSKKHYYTSGADAETGRNATLFYMYFFTGRK